METTEMDKQQAWDKVLAYVDGNYPEDTYPQDVYEALELLKPDSRPHASVTLRLEDDGQVGMTVEFEPMAKKEGDNPITHAAAMVGASAIVDWLKGDADDMSVPSTDSLGERES